MSLRGGPLAQQRSAKRGELVGRLVEHAQDCGPVLVVERDDARPELESLPQPSRELVVRLVEQPGEFADGVSCYCDSSEVKQEHTFHHTVQSGLPSGCSIRVPKGRGASVTAATRLEALVGPVLAGAILDALHEELAAASPTPEPANRWLTVDQAADYLGTTAKAIRRRIDRGRLQVARDGRRVYVDRQALDEAFAAKGRILRATTQEAPAPLSRPGARTQEV